MGADNTVKIWSLRPLEDEEAEGGEEEEEERHEKNEKNKDENKEERNKDEKKEERAPRLLATLTSHQLGVNCVRWAPDGELLASGGDDAVIMLWRLEAGTTTVFGQENIENWSPVIMLRGHTGEVTGLAWSPDGSLVSDQENCFFKF